MPQLELEGPELQALGAVQQKIGPLIAKRILDDKKRITHRVVLSSWIFFKFEIDQMFLYITKGQDLPQNDFDAFLSGLHQIFQLLEDFLDDKVLDPIDNSPALMEERSPSSVSVTPPGTDGIEQSSYVLASYPKLKALTSRASQSSTFLDLSNFLCLPETVEKSREAEEMITNFNTGNKTRSNAATRLGAGDINHASERHKAWNRTTPRSEYELVEKSQQCISRLLNALKQNISTSACSSNHIAKIQIRYPDDSIESTDGVQHKFFVSCCLLNDKCQETTASSLSPWKQAREGATHQVQWQETTCTVASQLLSPDSKLKAVRNICKAIQKAFKFQCILDISVHESGILGRPLSRMIKMPPVRPTLSLEDILESGLSFLTYHKVVLALNLSHALLRMYHAGMQNRQWTAGDIYFLCDIPERKVYEAYNPYLAHSLTGPEGLESPNISTAIKFPILVYFAQILLEIALEKSLGDLGPHPHVALREVVDENDVELFEMGSSYRDAAMACLEANCLDFDDEDSDDSDSGQDAPNDNDEWRCREVFFEVVSHLEDARRPSSTYRTSRKDPRKNPNYAYELSVPQITQSRCTSPILNGAPQSANLDGQQSTPLNAPGQCTIKMSPRNQLFDDRRLPTNTEDSSKVSLSDAFFEHADRFYVDKIQDLPPNRRVRIAILDTGIDEGIPFFRGVKRSRRSKDTPFKAKKSFVGGTMNDTFGHGNNVAALILKMAPEADLYIAKISESQQVDHTSQIVDAIKWARERNVHIITMSFGLARENDDISHAIEEAEYNGAIMFAAASNYGGNTGIAFPARSEKVLCIHASDGNGNKSGMDPSPRMGRENFSTLGVAIPSVTEKGIYLSGTSYSTPVAVGIAANILRLVQNLADTNKLAENQLMRAFSRTGMKNILLTMSNKRDGYHYVAPWWGMWNNVSTKEQIAWKIEEALDRDMY